MKPTKAETNFTNRIKGYPEKVFLSVAGADQEGFEYFASDY